jgi:hypothetical protein
LSPESALIVLTLYTPIGRASRSIVTDGTPHCGEGAAARWIVGLLDCAPFSHARVSDFDLSPRPSCSPVPRARELTRPFVDLSMLIYYGFGDLNALNDMRRMTRRPRWWLPWRFVSASSGSECPSQSPRCLSQGLDEGHIDGRAASIRHGTLVLYWWLKTVRF